MQQNKTRKPKKGIQFGEVMKRITELRAFEQSYMKHRRT